MRNFNLKLHRNRIFIELINEVDSENLVPVREVANCIDFILDDDDAWEYDKLDKSWVAEIKVRQDESEEILEFIEENKDKLVLDAMTKLLLKDLTKVYKISIEHKKEKQLRDMDKEEITLKHKNNIIAKIKQTITTINSLSDCMNKTF